MYPARMPNKITMTYQKSIDVINPIPGQPYGITVFGIPSALAAQDRPARVSISTWATVHFTQTLTPAAARLLASTLTEAADAADRRTPPLTTEAPPESMERRTP